MPAGMVHTYYWQNALDGVRMNVGHVLTSDLEVAKSDTRKGDVTVLGPVAVLNHVLCHVETERRVLGREDEVEQEQLTDGVGDVADLGEEEEHDEIVADPVKRGTFIDQSVLWHAQVAMPQKVC